MTDDSAPKDAPPVRRSDESEEAWIFRFQLWHYEQRWGKMSTERIGQAVRTVIRASFPAYRGSDDRETASCSCLRSLFISAADTP